ncbi:ABC transporter substrate-binding protein [Bradyrhizobium liaoningense]
MAFICRVLLVFCAVLFFPILLARPGGAEDRVRVAVIAPMSGPLATFGQSLLQGATAAATQLNASHGIMGRKIELITFDDGAQPPRAADAARRAVDGEKAQFIVGHMTQLTSMAAGRIYAERKVLQIEPRGSRLPSDSPGGDTLFNMCGADGTGAVVVKNYLERQFKTNLVGMVSEEDEYNRTKSSRLSDAFTKAGGKVIGSEATNGKDIQSGINRVESRGARAAIVDMAGDISFTSKLSNLRQFSPKIPVFVDVPADVPTGYLAGMSPSPSLYVLQEVDQSIGLTGKLSELAALQKQSTYLSNSFLFGYAAVEAIAKGAEQAHSFDPVQVAGWLRSGHPAPTILGNVSFDGKGQGSIQRFAIYGFGKGQFRPDGTEVTCDKGCACKDGGCGCECPKKR